MQQFLISTIKLRSKAFHVILLISLHFNNISSYHFHSQNYDIKLVESSTYFQT